jgi:hypothetical protein
MMQASQNGQGAVWQPLPKVNPTDIEKVTMDASPEVLRELFLALREQVKARVADPRSSTIADDASVAQFDTLAQAADAIAPVSIPPLNQRGNRYYTELLDSLNFAISVVATVASEEATGLEGNENLPVSNQHGAATETVVDPQPPKPTVFIGCSTEGTQYAMIIQLQLEHRANCAIWNQGVFGPMPLS